LPTLKDHPDNEAATKGERKGPASSAIRVSRGGRKTGETPDSQQRACCLSGDSSRLDEKAGKGRKKREKNGVASPGVNPLGNVS